ncbi:hypothetical protein [Variovorax sp. RA8]|uniref:hypothetical protein n=1 Tax=Variovorax sp. (strain JCM 16519 / RA8) TaxID=662548 RepID=UPI000AEEF942|nr:hypothetical protein [Variovorax sp. RA8]VTU17295.1 hypothetical protein RA8CHR_01484 [Variovorax sp. RA8]
MTDIIRTDLVLSQSAFCHVINVPIEQVDTDKWLFSLAEAEYQRCVPPAALSRRT